MVQTIDSFRGEYDFLSNFYPSDIHLTFVWAPRLSFKMPTAEHAFQSLKTVESNLDIDQRMLWLLQMAREATPTGAKHLGRAIDLNVKTWNNMSEYYMGRIQQEKYLQNPDLAARLITTGDAYLIEGNTWGDKIWGQVDGKGENRLGKILMAVRQQLVERAENTPSESVAGSIA